MDFYSFIEINEWLVYYWDLRVRVSSRIRDDCHPRALFFLIWGVTWRHETINVEIISYQTICKFAWKMHKTGGERWTKLTPSWGVVFVIKYNGISFLNDRSKNTNVFNDEVLKENFISSLENLTYDSSSQVNVIKRFENKILEKCC
jgi:hypothetical protein